MERHRSLRVSRRAAFAIGAVGVALCLPWRGSEPMDHLEYALVAETALAESWSEVLVNRVGIEQAHQPLSRVPIAVARRLGLPPESTRWVSLGAWALALVGAWSWLGRLLVARPSDGGRGPAGAQLSAFACVAFSPLAVRYAFDVTPYAFFACCAWWSACFVFGVPEGTAHARWLAVIAATVAFYGHYVALPFFAGVVAHAWFAAAELEVVERRRARLDLVTVAALFALAIVPWIPAMRWGGELFRRYVSRERDLYALDLSSLAQLRELARIVTGAPGVGGAVLLSASVVSTWMLGDSRMRSLLGRVALALAPYAAFRTYQQHQYAVAAGGTYFGARHFLPFLPLAALLPVLAVEPLGARLARSPRLARGFIRVAWVALPSVALVASLAGLRHASRPDIRSAAAYLRANLADGDAVGVLPRFFHSPLVVDEVSRGSVAFQDASGFARLALDDSSDRRPLVWLPADDREFPLPEALENRAFERVWVLDFQEREFGLLEVAPLVSQRVTAHMDAAHALLERRAFDQIVLSLYRLDPARAIWSGDPWILDESNWRQHARDVSWSTDGDRLVYRIDLPSPTEPRLAELSVVFAASEDGRSTEDVGFDLAGNAELNQRIDVPAAGDTRSVRFPARTGEPLVLRLDYPKDRVQLPTRISLTAVVGPSP